jgi:hypothetical protein
MRADSSGRSICSASLCNVSGGERRSACSEPPSHIVDNRSDLWVRIAVAEVRHEARGVGEAKMSAPDEGLGGVGARRIVGGPAASKHNRGKQPTPRSTGLDASRRCPGPSATGTV